MGTRVLVTLIVQGSAIFGRAYRQALANASKSGVAQEAVQSTIRRGSKTMTEEEARKILDVPQGSSLEEIVKKYNMLFENNHKGGSFYLQSQVHRAKECLEEVYKVKNQHTSG